MPLYSFWQRLAGGRRQVAKAGRRARREPERRPRWTRLFLERLEDRTLQSTCGVVPTGTRWALNNNRTFSE